MHNPPAHAPQWAKAGVLYRNRCSARPGSDSSASSEAIITNLELRFSAAPCQGLPVQIHQPLDILKPGSLCRIYQRGRAATARGPSGEQLSAAPPRLCFARCGRWPSRAAMLMHVSRLPLSRLNAAFLEPLVGTPCGRAFSSGIDKPCTENWLVRSGNAPAVDRTKKMVMSSDIKLRRFVAQRNLP